LKKPRDPRQHKHRHEAKHLHVDRKRFIFDSESSIDDKKNNDDADAASRIQKPNRHSRNRAIREVTEAE
jgi:hypothetical protein